MTPATNKRQRGVKISFEGIDGSGKTTQTLLLREFLEERGYRTYRSPDNSEASGEGLDGRILTLLRKGGDRFFRVGYPVTETLLLAGRAAYVNEVHIIPSLEAGEVVVSDRDVDTFIAYGLPSLRKAAPELPSAALTDWMISLCTLGRTWPDLTILFEPDPDIFLPRATLGVYETQKQDVFDDSSRQFINEVISHYEELYKRFPERICKVLIGTDSPQEVFKKVIGVVIPFLEKTYDKPFNK